jgi:peptidoglycan/LPS O-acetylase OafA/YrhL
MAARVFGLDVIRAASIAVVVVGHGLTFWGIHAGAPVRVVAIVPGLGVGWFFVLSGFLIGGIFLRDMTDDGRLATLRGFWRRRWFRTLPNYYLAIVINLVVASMVVLPAWFSWRHLVFLQNFAWPGPVVFQESWSLAVEEWFYLAFPAVAVLLALWLKRSARQTALWVALAMVAMSPFLRAVATLWHGTPFSDLAVMTVMRFDELGLGILAAWLQMSAPRWWSSRGPATIWMGANLMIMGIGAWFWGGLRLESSGPVDAAVRALAPLLSGVGLFLLLPALNALPAPPAVWRVAIERVSIYSYALYLLHIPVARLLALTIDASLYTTALGATLVIAIWIAASFCTAALVYHLYERPMMALRDRQRIVTTA